MEIGDTAEAIATTRLDRAKIVQVAIDLLDEVGLDGLSTRLLAARLGVKSPALYWHFKNKRDLADAMAVAMMDAIDWPDLPSPDGDVTEWMAGRAHAFRRALLSHRDGARVHSGTRPNARQLASIEAQVLALVASGMTPTTAARTALALSRYTVGWVLEEQAAHVSSADDSSLQDFPTLTAASSVFTENDSTEEFDFGVRALLAGVAGYGRTPTT